MEHFALTPEQLNRNGAQTALVQAAVIRDITEGIIPQRQNIAGRIPFNLMKSETLIWVMQDVDYLEVVTCRERRGSSHGLSIRVARGVYYRPGTFRSRNVEWGRDRPPGHRPLGVHHQAPVLLGQQEEIPGQVRPDCGFRAVQRRVRADEGSSDRKAAVLPDRGRMVRIQPRHQPSTDVNRDRHHPSSQNRRRAGPGRLGPSRKPHRSTLLVRPYRLFQEVIVDEIVKLYERVERRYRPESYRQRADIAEEENQALRERIAELESREEIQALRDRIAELERQIREDGSRRRRRRRNNPPR